MTEKAMSDALNAIQDEVLKLLKYELPPEVKEGLLSIESIARHGHDVRNEGEKARRP